MVNSAIANLNERGGSSLMAINKYLTSTYQIDAVKMATFIKKYLRTAVTGGQLIQTTGKGATGSFKLAPAKSTAVVKKKKPAEKMMDKKKLADKKVVEKMSAEKKQMAEKKSAEKKLAEKKPAEKKPAEKKPPEKKPAEKKPAEKKTADKNPEEKKSSDKKAAEEKPKAKNISTNVAGKKKVK